MGSGKRTDRKSKLRADAQFNKTLEGSQNLCCCCGLFSASEPNALCKDCAESCAGYLLGAKPCLTIETCNIRKFNVQETTGQ